MTGGTNAEYRVFVQRTIDRAKGLVVAEKAFASMYRGIDIEADDWLQIPFLDAAILNARMTLIPAALISVASQVVLERVRKHDRFGKKGLRCPEDIGGSPFFHCLDPMARRQLAGFPAPAEYLKLNLDRRRHPRLFERSPKFPDPDWRWMAAIEPCANIPCRSIHMLEFAVEFAHLRGRSSVDLFVGEIHNSDVAWLAGGGLDTLTDRDRDAVDTIVDKARKHALTRASGKQDWAAQLAFLAGVTVGSIPIAALGALATVAIMTLCGRF